MTHAFLSDVWGWCRPTPRLVYCRASTPGAAPHVLRPIVTYIMTMQRYRWQGWTRWYGWALLGLGCSTALARGHYQEQRPEGVPGQFDYYLLSLSWSPTYCLTHPYDRMQCAGKGYGFVLHGLWPQYDSGGYPSYCAASSLSEAAQALGQTLYPSPKLLQHEWAEHGSCSGMDALAYFRTADRATAAVRIPRATLGSTDLPDPIAPDPNLRARTAQQLYGLSSTDPKRTLTGASDCHRPARPPAQPGTRFPLAPMIRKRSLLFSGARTILQIALHSIHTTVRNDCQA